MGEPRQELEKRVRATRSGLFVSATANDVLLGSWEGLGWVSALQRGNMDQSSTHRRTCCLRCYI